MRRLLLVAFFLEIGFVLIVVPWSAYWDRNYFVQALPVISPILTSNFTRGAVSGLGLINVLAGIAELVSHVMSRHQDRPASISGSQLTNE